MNKAGFTTHTLVPGIFLAELEFSYRLRHARLDRASIIYQDQ